MITENQIRNILRYCEVPACWHRAYCLLMLHDEINDPKFSKLLNYDRAFKRACDMCFDILSGPWAHLFPENDAESEWILAIAGKA